MTDLSLICSLIYLNRDIYFCGRKPLLVFTMTLSNTINMDGNTKITTTILISAPLAIRIHGVPL